MTQEQITEKVAEYKAKGCKLSDEKIVEIILKAEKNAAKNLEKAAKGFANREATSHIQASDNASQWLAEKNRENALNNLPSSMR